VKPTSRLFPVVLVLTFLMAFASDAMPNETEIAAAGTSTLGAKLGGKSLEISIRTVQLKNSDPLFPMEPGYAKEVSIIQGMAINIDGQSLFVPRSVFADLFNPRKASIALDKDAFVLSIVGADGADLYLVRVHFNAARIYRRMVYGAFDSKNATEDTRYRRGEVLDN
jgi:hypothetical protein